MWFGLALVCNMYTGECTTLVSAFQPTREACEATYMAAELHVTENMPDAQIMAFKCDTWGTPA